MLKSFAFLFFFFQAEDGIRDRNVTGVQTCALPILPWAPVRGHPLARHPVSSGEISSKAILGLQCDLLRSFFVSSRLRGCIWRKALRRVLWLVPLAVASCRNTAPSPPRPASAHPNIVLVTIDTWRADRLGAGISPALDRLAAAGMRFTTARTAAPLTLPSHATILTGLLPPAHGVRVNGLDRLS